MHTTMQCSTSQQHMMFHIHYTRIHAHEHADIESLSDVSSRLYSIITLSIDTITDNPQSGVCSATVPLHCVLQVDEKPILLCFCLQQIRGQVK